MEDRIVAAPDFNRWKMPAVSVAIHLCIGSVYSWSVFNPALVKELGVVTSAATTGTQIRWFGYFRSLSCSLGLPLP